MSFKAAIMYPVVIFFLFGLVQVLASRMDESLIVLNTEEATRDTLTIHGETGASDLPAPECNRENRADLSSCSVLISSLTINSTIFLNQSPRDICYTENGHQCCVSWGKTVTGLQKGDLSDSAFNIFSICKASAGVSGVQRDIVLQGTNTIVCLSNRSGRCNG